MQSMLQRVEMGGSGYLCCEVSKTSGTGLFSNKRMLVIGENLIGYLSTPPEKLIQITADQLKKGRKQAVNILTAKQFYAGIQPDTPNKLIVSWNYQATPRQWEFLFFNSQDARTVLLEIQKSRIAPSPQTSLPSPQTSLPTPLTSLPLPIGISSSRFPIAKVETAHLISTYASVCKSPMTTTIGEQQLEWNTRWLTACAGREQEQMMDMSMQFGLRCVSVVKEIVGELGCLLKDREFIPIESDMQSTVYEQYGILFKRRQDPRQDEREFREYERVLSATWNLSLHKVPLSCLIKHKSITFLCVAKHPHDYSLCNIATVRQFLDDLLANVDYSQLRVYSNPPNTLLSNIRSNPDSKAEMSVINDFLKQEYLSPSIVSHADLLAALTRHSVHPKYIGCVHQLSRSTYLTRLLKSQAASQVFIGLVERDNNNTQQLLGKLISGDSELWSRIAEQSYTNHSIPLERESVQLEYILEAVRVELGLHQDGHFETMVIRYSPQCYGESQAEIMSLLNTIALPNFTRLTSLLSLNVLHLKGYSEHYTQAILCYCSQFVAYQREQPYEHLGIYKSIPKCSNHSLTTITLSALKWLLSEDNLTQALALFNSFKKSLPSGPSPYFVIFLNTFAEYHKRKMRHSEAIQCAKQSLQNSVALYSASPILLVDQHYYLAELNMGASRHHEALCCYKKIKSILDELDCTPATLLLPVAQLYLHLGDIPNSLRTTDALIRLAPEADILLKAYLLALRGLEIMDPKKQLASYLQRLEDCFDQTADSHVFRQVLKVVVRHELVKVPPLKLRKLTQLMYLMEEGAQLGGQLRGVKGVKQQFLSAMEIVEQLSRELLIATHQKSYRIRMTEEHENRKRLLQRVCETVGYEYVLGVVKMTLYY